MAAVSDPAHAAWTRYAGELIKLDGVISVAPGQRIKRGKQTAERVVVVTVVSKRPLEELEQRLANVTALIDFYQGKTVLQLIGTFRRPTIKPVARRH